MCQNVSQAFAISRRIAPELCQNITPNKRAQGRPGADLAHGPPAEKKQAAVTTGSAETSRPSLREWSYGLYVISPGTGCLAPVDRGVIKLRDLGISTGMPGPHDFTVRTMPFVRV
jgi:hypothetical protein